jgi:hypothetical protein
MVDSGDWPEYSDYESPREEIQKELFCETGETFLDFLDTIRNMAKAAESLAEQVVTLDFSNPQLPQDFYGYLVSYEQGVSLLREGFINYCAAMGVNLDLIEDIDEDG